MFDLEITVVAPDTAKRPARTTKSRKRSGRGAPGRPKSAAHRKAISAGLKRYWRSKRSSYRRRKSAKTRSGGKSTGRSKKSRAKANQTPDRAAPQAKRNAAKRARVPAPKIPKNTVNAPKRGKPKKPKNATATGAQVAAAAAKPRTFARRRGGSVPRIRRTR